MAADVSPGLTRATTCRRDNPPGAGRNEPMTMALLLPLLASLGPGSTPPPEAPPVEQVAVHLGVDSRRTADVTEAQRAIAARAGDRLVSLCPHCRPGTLSEDGPCGWARAQRTVLKNAAALGLDEEQIVAAYRQVYGDRILALSTETGWAAGAWIIPYAGAILGLASTFLVARRLVRRPSASEEGRGSERSAASPRDPRRAESEAALVAELRALD